MLFRSRQKEDNTVVQWGRVWTSQNKPAQGHEGRSEGLCVCTPLFLSSSSFSYELLVDLDQNFPEGQVREWGVNEGGKMAEGSRHPPGGPARGSERSPGQPARLPPAGGTSSSVETGEKLQARAWRFVLNLYPSCQRCSLEQAPENLREARFPRFPPL